MEELYTLDISEYLSHDGRKGMHWYQHIFGDDPRYGKNGRDEDGNKKSGMAERIKKHNEEAKAQRAEKKEAKKAAKAADSDLPIGVKIKGGKPMRPDTEAESFLKKKEKKIQTETRDDAKEFKRKALRSSDPRMVAKYSENFTNSELDAYKKRLKNLSDIKTYAKLAEQQEKENTKTAKAIKFIKESAGMISDVTSFVNENKPLFDAIGKVFNDSSDGGTAAHSDNKNKGDNNSKSNKGNNGSKSNHGSARGERAQPWAVHPSDDDDDDEDKEDD